MSPRKSSGGRTQVKGTGPNGKVELSDIRSKLEEIRGETVEGVEKAKPAAMMGAVGGAVLLVLIAYLLGRRRGKRKSTWVEIRRM